MSDHPDHPAPDDPHPTTPHGADDFPADFFDDVAEPSPVSMNPPFFEEPNADPEPFLGAEPAAPKAFAATPSAEPAPVVQARPNPAATANASLPPENAPRRAPVFPIVMGLLFLGAIGAAVFVSRMDRTPEAAPAPTVAAAAVPTPAPPANDTTAAEVQNLKGQVDALSDQLKGLTAKVDGLPKPPPAVDLAPVQGKLDELAKGLAGVSTLPEKVGKLDERFEGVDGRLKTVNEKVAALSDEVKKAAETSRPGGPPAAAAAAAPAPAAAEPVKPEADRSAAALAEGAQLFKAGKYKEAADVFKALRDGDARDARVYYYAALANGLTTNDWKDATVKIASRGAELEKAGSPGPAEVDAAFTDLPSTLKPWLAFFRKGAK